MIKFLKTYEKFLLFVLIFMMGVVVLLSTVELGWLLIQDIFTPPMFLLEAADLLDLFGIFLLVLIGIELLETIKAYFVEHVIHAEIVVEVALIAIARKVIILDVKEMSSLTLLGIAAIILALAVAYWFIKRSVLALSQHAESE